MFLSKSFGNFFLFPFIPFVQDAAMENGGCKYWLIVCSIYMQLPREEMVCVFNRLMVLVNICFAFGSYAPHLFPGALPEWKGLSKEIHNSHFYGVVNGLYSKFMNEVLAGTSFLENGLVFEERVFQKHSKSLVSMMKKFNWMIVLKDQIRGTSSSNNS